jgi:hybrid cluster-associated redox disulfide protein
MAEKKKITKDMTFADVLQNFPETMEVFGKHGLHCIGCAIGAFENLEQGCQVHGIKVEDLVDDLNKAVEEAKKEKKE